MMSFARQLLPIALVGLIVTACGSPDRTTASSPAQSSVTQTNAAPNSWQTVPPPEPAEPGAPGAPGAPGQDSNAGSPLWPAPPAPERDVKRLITENAAWHAPEFLTEGVTETIALSIGDTQRLREALNAAVPSDVPRAPTPVTVTAGTIIRAKLSVIASDATITPIDTIDKSIGDDVSILFPWQIQPHVAGELRLEALISCPHADGNDATTEVVSFRIPVHAAESHADDLTNKGSPNFADRLRDFLDLLKDYWVQITALAGLLAAGTRFGWRRYNVRRGATAGDAADAKADAAPPSEGKP